MKKAGKTVVVVTNFPYRKGTTADADAVVCNFSGSPDSIRAAADLLFGAVKACPTTKMPIDLSAEKNIPVQVAEAGEEASRQETGRQKGLSIRRPVLSPEIQFNHQTDRTQQCQSHPRLTSAISTPSTGTRSPAIYEQNKMAVHFQGMSKILLFPQTVAIQGAPTCSIGISPYGLYNRLNDAGRLIMLNQKAIQFGSAPFIRVGDKFTMLTQKQPGATELADDIPAVKNYYSPPVDAKNVALTIATPSAEFAYKVGKLNIIRRLISPLLAGNEQTLMPLCVEEFEVTNNSKEPQTVTLVVPRPSLVNLQEKELKPTDQDSVYICTAAVHGQVHETFESDGVRGIVMGSKETRESDGAGRRGHARRCD